MATLITDRELEQRLQAARHAAGADRYDEVWEGTYMMTPMPNDEHQQLVSRFAAIFQDVIDWPGLGHVRPGVNISDRIEKWQEHCCPFRFVSLLGRFDPRSKSSILTVIGSGWCEFRNGDQTRGSRRRDTPRGDVPQRIVT
jgi:hypothetical protein